jgi:hypothetical protein
MMKTKTGAAFILAIVFVITLLAVIIPALPVFAAPSISISPSSGVSGTRVTVNGSSFSSYTGDQLSVYFDNTEVTPNVVAVSNGIIPQTSFVIPDKLIPGNHIVSIKGSPGVILAQAQFYVAQPEIILSRWSATVGSTITATCDGFHAGQTVTFQYYTGAEEDQLTFQTAGDTGECTVQFNVPAGAAGNHEILASNQIGDYAPAYLEVTPSLNINLPVASIGDKVDITGTGFSAGDEVDIILYGQTIAMATTTDRGSFDAGFIVPVIKAGIYSLEIEETAKSIRWIDFTVAPQISVSAAAGDIGVKLNVDGKGFGIGALVQINYDTEEMTTATADDTGSFSAHFNVPVSASGPHNIIVTDGLNTKQAVFTVSSTPPPVPDIYVPRRDSAVAAQVAFAWGSVYDPNEPVSYTLQVSQTKDFLQPILEKKGLSLSEYTLTKAEALLPTRQFTDYYWRVRAVDSASNVGDWSQPVAFQVQPANTIPQWANYILIGIGVLLVIILVARIVKAVKLLKTEKKT